MGTKNPCVRRMPPPPPLPVDPNWLAREPPVGWALGAGNCSRVVAVVVVGRVEEGSLPGVVDGVPAKENIWGGG